MDQCESKIAYELLWHSGGNFWEASLPATLGMSLLFPKSVLVTVAGSGTLTGLNQHSKSTWLSRKQWKIVSDRKSASLYIHILHTVESVDRLKCFRSVGKPSKSPREEEKRNYRMHSQNDSVWYNKELFNCLLTQNHPKTEWVYWFLLQYQGFLEV